MTQEDGLAYIQALQQFPKIHSKSMDAITMIGALRKTMSALIVGNNVRIGGKGIELIAELMRGLRPAMYHDKRLSFADIPIAERDAVAGNECFALHNGHRNSFGRPVSRPSRSIRPICKN
jgi:hypothetical protein